MMNNDLEWVKDEIKGLNEEFNDLEWEYEKEQQKLKDDIATRFLIKSLLMLIIIILIIMAVLG